MERKRRMNNKWRVWVLLLSAWFAVGSVITGAEGKTRIGGKHNKRVPDWST
ncbi:hypothetical protein KZ483_02675 [Paenibacillus sp. sptzw28]|uniref:hypothetical protein n=1 Tax=Paenibacillus sp. sptzw28 TaxID=715179 RepID=UPI001C6E6DE6|nr:hypothetical protein [Paenibacillus sp. sptzw28]QYR21959.1 hypothetical protein KZ483_02675 [Paenibacillus sp. sptzw28]